jgi:hypothetical protein
LSASARVVRCARPYRLCVGKRKPAILGGLRLARCRNLLPALLLRLLLFPKLGHELGELLGLLFGTQQRHAMDGPRRAEHSEPERGHDAIRHEPACNVDLVGDGIELRTVAARAARSLGDT